jgi:hypothetical protein
MIPWNIISSIIPWRLLAAVVGAGLLYWLGYASGSDKVQREWYSDKLVRAAVLQAHKEQAEKDVALAFTTLEKRLMARSGAFDKAMGELKDEVRNNRVYSDCRITDNGMRLYLAAGGSGEGQADAEPVAEVPSTGFSAKGLFDGFRLGNGHRK